MERRLERVARRLTLAALVALVDRPSTVAIHREARVEADLGLISPRVPDEHERGH